MNARLKTSQKWTNFPNELLEQIRQVFNDGFADWREKQPGKFIAEGRVYPNELLFRIGYLHAGQLTQANFEISLDFDAVKQNAVEQIHFCVDCAAALMQEYIDHDQDLHIFPREWQQQEIGKRQVYVRISTNNTELEAEADRLLGIADDALVRGQTDD